jgi:hypothetical protein
MAVSNFSIMDRSSVSRAAHAFSAKLRTLRGKIYAPLVVALGVGGLLRIAAMIAAYPAIFHSRDMLRFARIWPPNLFDDYSAPVGYPLVLRILQAISNQIAPVIVLQHAAGLGIGILGYAVARRLGAPRAVGVATALPALLSGDLLFIEHSLASETLFTLLVAAGLFAGTIAIVRHSIMTFVLASCLLGLSTLVRGNGFVLPGALAAGAVVSLWRSPRVLALALVAALVPAATVVVAYIALARLTGGYPGLFEMNGFALYGRVAPFADCARFRPPTGTAVLCETRPVSQRPGPMWYFSPNRPAVSQFTIPGQLFGFRAIDERKNGLFRRFALEVIKHQPLDYAHEVLLDAARYFVPTLDKRAEVGLSPGRYDFRAVDLWEDESWLTGLMAHKYRDAHIHRQSVLLNIIGEYGSIVRFNGVVLLLALGASLIGVAVTPDHVVRAALVMLLATAAVLYLLPVFVSTYDFRYGFPGQVPLGWAAALGTWSVFSERRRRQRGLSPSADG